MEQPEPDERLQKHRDEMKHRMFNSYHNGELKQKKQLKYLKQKIPEDVFDELYERYGDLCYDMYRIQKIMNESVNAAQLKEYLVMPEN